MAAALPPYGQGRLFKTFPGCRQCLEGLARTAAELAAGGDPGLLRRAREAGQRALAQSEGAPLSPPEVANRILRAVRQETGARDPYREFKAREQAAARQAAIQARELMGDSLESLVGLAALGNSLDFFKAPAEAMAEVRASLREGFSLHHNDTPRLERFLAAGRGLALYLTDNAGEIFFDLPLFRRLGRRLEKVVLVVKGGPALNDLTRDDLAAAGLLGEFAQVADTGVEGAGVEWPLVSEEFKALVEQAGLIVAKGMANFESLYPLSLPSPVFHIFRVKCRPMRDYLHAPVNSHWALWRAAGGKRTEGHP